jgi:hypothetical protein
MKKNDNGITITVIQSLEEWDALRPVWEQLWRQMPDASVFTAFSFLRQWWRFFPKRFRTPFILLLKDEAQEPIGIAPLMLKKVWAKGIPLRGVFLMEQNPITDRPQLLLPTRKTEQLKAIFEFLDEKRQVWDLLLLNEQVIDDDYKTVFSDAFQDDATYHFDMLPLSFEPYLVIEPGIDTWETYLSTRTKKHRKRLRYFQNRLSKEGQMTITRHSEEFELDQAILEYRKLQECSWKKNKQAATGRKTLKFYRSLSDALKSEGKIHFVFLRLNEKPIAGLIGLSYGNRYAALNTVFDGVYSQFSPGFLIGGYDMQWVIEKGEFTEYDFMSAFLADKLQWTDTFRKTCFLRTIHKRGMGKLFNFVKFQVMTTLKKVGQPCGITQGWERRFQKKLASIKTSKIEKHNNTLQAAEEQ